MEQIVDGLRASAHPCILKIVSTGYGEQGNEYLLKTIMHNSKRLFGRTGLMQNEVNMLRGIFAQIIERVKR